MCIGALIRSSSCGSLSWGRTDHMSCRFQCCYFSQADPSLRNPSRIKLEEAGLVFRSARKPAYAQKGDPPCEKR